MFETSVRAGSREWGEERTYAIAVKTADPNHRVDQYLLPSEDQNDCTYRQPPLEGRIFSLMSYEVGIEWIDRHTKLADNQESLYQFLAVSISSREPANFE